MTSLTPGLHGANGIPAQQAILNGAANPGTMRPPSQGNAGQAMNPIKVNEGSHYPVRMSNRRFLYLLRPLLNVRFSQLLIQGALQPSSQGFTLPVQNNLSGLVFNSYTEGLPIPITDLETWVSNNNLVI